MVTLKNTSARPEVRGTADVGWRSLFPLTVNPPRRLVLTHDFIITHVYKPTGSDKHVWVKTTRTLVCAPFLCRLRRRECCMLGAPSSQPTVPLHELPPARLVIHRQTSAHEQRKGAREGSIEVGHFSVLMHPASLAVDNGQAPHFRRAPRGG